MAGADERSALNSQGANPAGGLCNQSVLIESVINFVHIESNCGGILGRIPCILGHWKHPILSGLLVVS